MSKNVRPGTALHAWGGGCSAHCRAVVCALSSRDNMVSNLFRQAWRLGGSCLSVGLRGGWREAAMWVTCALLLPVPARLRSMRPALPATCAALSHRAARARCWR